MNELLRVSAYFDDKGEPIIIYKNHWTITECGGMFYCPYIPTRMKLEELGYNIEKLLGL